MNDIATRFKKRQGYAEHQSGKSARKQLKQNRLDSFDYNGVYKSEYKKIIELLDHYDQTHKEEDGK
jgi:hypothetical protein